MNVKFIANNFHKKDEQVQRYEFATMQTPIGNQDIAICPYFLRFELCHFKKIKKELPCRFKYSDMANKLDPMDLKQILTLHLDGYSNRK